MSPFTNFDWSFKSIAKVLGILVLGMVALVVVIALISFSIRTIFQSGNRGYDRYDYAYNESVESFGGATTLSKRAMPSMGIGIPKPPIPEPDYSTGDDAEEYEVKTYDGRIETRKLDKTCSVISDLKVRDDVIFERSETNEDRCYFSFKVKKEVVDEIVVIIENLDPEYFNARIETIKESLEYYQDELDILQKKLAETEKTLESAQSAYDELTVLATRQRDVESLTKIIDNKLKLIDKLSDERFYINERIDRYSKNQAEQLDRLNYSFFKITVVENLIFDWEEIKDQWKWDVQELIDNLNDLFTDLTVNMLSYLTYFVRIVIYVLISLFLALFVLKSTWGISKRIWRGKR